MGGVLQRTRTFKGERAAGPLWGALASLTPRCIPRRLALAVPARLWPGGDAAPRL